MIRARRIKLGEERRTGGRETSREPTAWAGFCHGQAAVQLQTGQQKAYRAGPWARLPLCWRAKLFSQGSWKRSWPISSPNDSIS